MSAPAKLSAKAAMPMSASPMCTQSQAPESAGTIAGSWGRAAADLRLNTSTTGRTKAPSTRMPERRSTHISSSTSTHTATDTASETLPSGGGASSWPSATSATGRGAPDAGAERRERAGRGRPARARGGRGEPVDQLLALDHVGKREARRQDVGQDREVQEDRVHGVKMSELWRVYHISDATYPPAPSSVRSGRGRREPARRAAAAEGGEAPAPPPPHAP